MGVSRRSLQDGKVLTLLLTRNQAERSVESLSGVFRCLRDSQVWLALEQPEKETLLPSPANGRPHLIRDGAGARYLPVFSEPGQMPENYRERFTATRVSFLRCIDLASELPGVGQIAVNPFGANLTLNPLQLKTIGELPSEIED